MENSEVVREVLTTMIKISTRKTTAGHAVFVMDSLIKKLEGKYDFLKHIEIKDTRFLEDSNPVSVMSDVNSVSSDEIGRAIREIIATTNESLGKDAGYFFIKEISHNIRDDYHSTIKDMGIDLSMMQLESEVTKMEKGLMKTRKID